MRRAKQRKRRLSEVYQHSAGDVAGAIHTQVSTGPAGAVGDTDANAHPQQPFRLPKRRRVAILRGSSDDLMSCFVNGISQELHTTSHNGPYAGATAALGPRSAGRFDLGSSALLKAGNQARWRPNGNANVIPPKIPRLPTAGPGFLSGAPGPLADPLAWDASSGTSREPSTEATASASSKQRADSSGSAAPETVPSIGKQESHYCSGYSRAASASVSPGVELPSPRLGSIASHDRDSPAHHLAERDERESASVGGRRRAGSGSGSATSSLHAPPTFSDSEGVVGLWQLAHHGPAKPPASQAAEHEPLHTGLGQSAASTQSARSPVAAPRVPQLLAPGASYLNGGMVGRHSSSTSSSSSSSSSSSRIFARGNGTGIAPHDRPNGNAGSWQWHENAGRTSSQISGYSNGNGNGNWAQAAGSGASRHGANALQWRTPGLLSTADRALVTSRMDRKEMSSSSSSSGSGSGSGSGTSGSASASASASAGAATGAVDTSRIALGRTVGQPDHGFERSSRSSPTGPADEDESSDDGILAVPQIHSSHAPLGGLGAQCSPRRTGAASAAMECDEWDEDDGCASHSSHESQSSQKAPSLIQSVATAAGNTYAAINSFLGRLAASRRSTQGTRRRTRSRASEPDRLVPGGTGGASRGCVLCSGRSSQAADPSSGCGTRIASAGAGMGGSESTGGRDDRGFGGSAWRLLGWGPSDCTRHTQRPSSVPTDAEGAQMGIVRHPSVAPIGRQVGTGRVTRLSTSHSRKSQGSFAGALMDGGASGAWGEGTDDCSGGENQDGGVPGEAGQLVGQGVGYHSSHPVELVDSSARARMQSAALAGRARRRAMQRNHQEACKDESPRDPIDTPQHGQSPCAAPLMRFRIRTGTPARHRGTADKAAGKSEQSDPRRFIRLSTAQTEEFARGSGQDQESSGATTSGGFIRPRKRQRHEMQEALVLQRQGVQGDKEQDEEEEEEQERIGVTRDQAQETQSRGTSRRASRMRGVEVDEKQKEKEKAMDMVRGAARGGTATATGTAGLPPRAKRARTGASSSNGGSRSHSGGMLQQVPSGGGRRGSRMIPIAWRNDGEMMGEFRPDGDGVDAAGGMRVPSLSVAACDECEHRSLMGASVQLEHEMDAACSVTMGGNTGSDRGEDRSQGRDRDLQHTTARGQGYGSWSHLAGGSRMDQFTSMDRYELPVDAKERGMEDCVSVGPEGDTGDMEAGDGMMGGVGLGVRLGAHSAGAGAGAGASASGAMGEWGSMGAWARRGSCHSIGSSTGSGACIGSGGGSGAGMIMMDGGEEDGDMTARER